MAAAPRLSILSLFDPLSITQRLGSSSPDSDKENSVPKPPVPEHGQDQFGDFPMTAFSNKTHELHPQFDYEIKPKKRLVDVGDETIDADEGSVTMLAESLHELALEKEVEPLGAPCLLEATPAVGRSSKQSPDFLSMLYSPTRKSLALSPFINSKASSPPSSLLPSFDIEMSKCMSRSQVSLPRTPLADLSLVHTPRNHSPLPRKKLFERDSSPPTSPKSRPKSKTSPKTGSPLSSVVISSCYSDDEEIDNELARDVVPTIVKEPEDLAQIVECGDEVLDTIREEDGTGSDFGVADDKSHPRRAPEITFSVVEDLTLSSCASLAIDCTNTRLADVTSPLPKSVSPVPPEPTTHGRPRLSVPTARRRSRGADASDPRRTSVDLHSSFSFQLNNPESSFDLLNDRISFFGRESSFLEDDESFDLGKEEKIMDDVVNNVEAGGVEKGMTVDEILQALKPGSSREGVSDGLVAASPVVPRPAARQLRRPSTTPFASAPVFVPPPKPAAALASSSKLSLASTTPARCLAPTVPSILPLKIIKRSRVANATAAVTDRCEMPDKPSMGLPTAESKPRAPVMKTDVNQPGIARRVPRTSGVLPVTKHVPSRSVGQLADVGRSRPLGSNRGAGASRITSSVSGPSVGSKKEEIRLVAQRPIRSGLGGGVPRLVNTLRPPGRYTASQSSSALPRLTKNSLRVGLEVAAGAGALMPSDRL